MRRLIVIIIILSIIFVGMLIHQNMSMKTSDVTMQEIEKIENYMNQIYMWKEVTKEALPCFEEINQADENWVWEVVKKNLEEYELSYQQIQDEAIELFGEKFTKEFPKEGTNYLTYNKENNLYYAEGIELDQLEDVFLLDKIEKTKEGYEIEIIEYIEDYSQTANGQNEIRIRNIDDEELGKVSSEDEEQAKEIVKNNKDKLSRKKVILKLENEKLYVEKVYQ